MKSLANALGVVRTLIDPGAIGLRHAVYSVLMYFMLFPAWCDLLMKNGAGAHIFS